jgi:hypothetical protein
MPQLPLDTSVEAEYQDGFILSETEQNDQSAYVEMIEVDGVPTGPNTLSDIIEKRPEAEHGKMVRFSVYYHNARYDIDWRLLPDNARPIRFRDRSRWLDENGDSGVTDWHGCRFGWQWTDEQGRNQQFVKEL